MSRIIGSSAPKSPSRGFALLCHSPRLLRSSTPSRHWLAQTSRTIFSRLSTPAMPCLPTVHSGTSRTSWRAECGCEYLQIDYLYSDLASSTDWRGVTGCWSVPLNFCVLNKVVVQQTHLGRSRFDGCRQTSHC